MKTLALGVVLLAVIQEFPMGATADNNAESRHQVYKPKEPVAMNEGPSGEEIQPSNPADPLRHKQDDVEGENKRGSEKHHRHHRKHEGRSTGSGPHTHLTPGWDLTTGIFTSVTTPSPYTPSTVGGEEAKIINLPPPLQSTPQAPLLSTYSQHSQMTEDRVTTPAPFSSSSALLYTTLSTPSSEKMTTKKPQKQESDPWQDVGKVLRKAINHSIVSSVEEVKKLIKNLTASLKFRAMKPDNPRMLNFKDHDYEYPDLEDSQGSTQDPRLPRKGQDPSSKLGNAQSRADCHEINYANCLEYGSKDTPYKINCSKSVKTLLCPTSPRNCTKGEVYTFTPGSKQGEWSCYPQRKQGLLVDSCKTITLENCPDYWGEISCFGKETNLSCPIVKPTCPEGFLYKFSPRGWSCVPGFSHMTNCHDINEINCYFFENEIVTCNGMIHEVECPEKARKCNQDDLLTFTPDQKERWSCYPERHKDSKLTHCSQINLQNCHRFWGDVTCEGVHVTVSCPLEPEICPNDVTYGFSLGLNQEGVWGCPEPSESTDIIHINDCHDINIGNCAMYDTKNVKCSKVVENIQCPTEDVHCPRNGIYTFTPYSPAGTWSCYPAKHNTHPVPQCFSITSENCPHHWGTVFCDNKLHKLSCPVLPHKCKEDQAYVFTPHHNNNWTCTEEVAVPNCHMINISNCDDYDKKLVDCSGSEQVIFCPKETFNCSDDETPTFSPEDEKKWKCYPKRHEGVILPSCDSVTFENCPHLWGEVLCDNMVIELRCPLKKADCNKDEIYTFTPRPGNLNQWKCRSSKDFGSDSIEGYDYENE